MGSPASTSELMRFDDDAEVVAAGNPVTVHFDENECVHPERPVDSVEAVHDVEDDADGDHEASSLVGSVRSKPLPALLMLSQRLRRF